MLVSQQRQSPSGPEYYSSKLSHEGVGEPKRQAFLICGRDDKRISTQGQVLNLFLKHRIKIVQQSGYLDEGRHEFVLGLLCDMKTADITPEGIMLELRLLKTVRHARSIKMEKRLFDGFFFPMTILDNRVMVLDSQITFLIEHKLKGPEERMALVEVGRVYVLDIIRQIRKKFPPNSSEKVIWDNVLDYFKAAGIGRFSLLDVDQKTVQAIIRDPPLSERGAATGNHFIHGIVIGLIEAFQGRETSVVEDLHDAKTGRLFIVARESTKVPPTAQVSDADVKIKALEEVEKVIRSIEGPEKQPVTITDLATTSPTTLQQVLKTYENEGWVGGKIGYTPEIPKINSSAPIVVKYSGEQALVEERPKEANGSSVPKPEVPATGTEVPTKQAPQISSQTPEKLRKKPAQEERDEDNDLMKELKSAMGEDSLFFEESYFLE